MKQIPFVWDIFLEDALSVHDKELKEWPTVQAEYQAKLTEWQSRMSQVDQSAQSETAEVNRRKRKKLDADIPKVPVSRMQEGEDTLFLKLSATLKILLATSITEQNISRGAKLLEQYLIDFRDVSTSVVSVNLIITYVPCCIALWRRINEAKPSLVCSSSSAAT